MAAIWLKIWQKLFLVKSFQIVDEIGFLVWVFGLGWFWGSSYMPGYAYMAMPSLTVASIKKDI